MRPPALFSSLTTSGPGRGLRSTTRPEPIVPMINVVFLLLVFFLMSATLSVPEPVETRLPEAEGAGPAEGGMISLFLGRDGVAAFGAERGEAALKAALAMHRGEGAGPLHLRADEGAPAEALTTLIAALAAAGVDELALITLPPHRNGAAMVEQP